MERQKLSREDFNHICLDCGLTPDVKKNEACFNEASYFTLTHPISKEPIEIACYEEFQEDDHTYIEFGLPESVVPGVEPLNFSAKSSQGLTPELVRNTIKSLIALLDRECILRRCNVLSLDRFIRILTHGSQESRYDPEMSIKLSCTVQEFLDNPDGVTLTFQLWGN